MFKQLHMFKHLKILVSSLPNTDIDKNYSFNFIPNDISLESIRLVGTMEKGHIHKDAYSDTFLKIFLNYSTKLWC